MGENSKLFI